MNGLTDPAAERWHPPQQDFNDVLFEQLKRTPWFMISLVLHLVAFLVLSNLEFASVPKATQKRVEANLEYEQPEELIEEQPDELEDVQPDEESIDPPEIEQSPDEDQDQEQNESEDESIADQPLEGDQTNVAIGLGGGRAGFGSRGGGGRPGGGRHYAPAETQEPVRHGLAWLAKHQTPDEGYWDTDGYQEFCSGNICDGKGQPQHDAGVTGLALLAFLGAGHTHNAGKYKTNVRNGLKYLMRVQGPEGCFGVQSGHFMYSHAICTLAMAEAYGMTNSPLLRRPVERGLAFIYKAQNPNPSGTGKLAWRYTVQPGANDTSVTGWVVMALKSATSAGFTVPRSAFEGARAWIDQMTDDKSGRCGYVQSGIGPGRAPGNMARFPMAKSESTTAIGMLSRVFIGEDPDKSEAIRRGAKLCLERLPAWNEGDGSCDQYYWYYGTLAMFQVGGSAWKRWNKAMKRAIIDHQRKDGCEKGSWDPIGPWGEDGGRVYATAMLTMCLEVYYRYPRVFGTR